MNMHIDDLHICTLVPVFVVFEANSTMR
jgi:hypothetical protein